MDRMMTRGVAALLLSTAAGVAAAQSLARLRM